MGSISISPLIERTKRRRTNGAKKKSRGATSLRPEQFEPDDEEPQVRAPKAVKTVVLQESGGELTLSGDIDIFKLSGAERDFVFSLIDRMNEFEKKSEDR